uniref:Cysteine protease n=1 Tax=Callorhinchus milii TaxID=7868 RepID=A0A4W3I182_CALMI
MEDGELDEVDKLKTKILTAWHNVKYSWHVKTKTSFSRNSPVFLLGKCYHFKSDVLGGVAPGGEASDGVAPGGVAPGGVAPDRPSAACVPCNVEQFRRDFGSRVWLTYRRAFPPIGATGLTTDCGWGCTPIPPPSPSLIPSHPHPLPALIPSPALLSPSLILIPYWVWADVLDMDNQDSQGLKTVKQGTLERSEGLYRSLVEFSGSLKLSRKTNDDPVPVGSEQQGHVPSPTLSQDEICHRKIISWFADLPHPPFGMHRLTEVGKSLGKKAGDWYGPAVVAHIIRKALQEAQEPELQGLAVYVAQDCTVYVADLMETHSGGAVILLIPVRLGGEKVNSQYQDIIKVIAV